MGGIWITYMALLSILSIEYCKTQNITENRCKVPNKAPNNIEKVIALCQEEIKQTLIAEALEALNIQDVTVLTQTDSISENQEIGKNRRKRSFFSDDEKKIAGCLLQCVFRRKNALNALGYPTVEGIVYMYTEGITEKPYVLATVQAVHTCLNKIHIVVDQNDKINDGAKTDSKELGTTCEVAYQVFECVSDKIEEYCGQSP